MLNTYKIGYFQSHGDWTSERVDLTQNVTQIEPEKCGLKAYEWLANAFSSSYSIFPSVGLQVLNSDSFGLSRRYTPGLLFFRQLNYEYLEGNHS